MAGRDASTRVEVWGREWIRVGGVPAMLLSSASGMTGRGRDATDAVACVHATRGNVDSEPLAPFTRPVGRWRDTGGLWAFDRGGVRADVGMSQFPGVCRPPGEPGNSLLNPRAHWVNALMGWLTGSSARWLKAESAPTTSNCSTRTMAVSCISSSILACASSSSSSIGSGARGAHRHQSHKAMQIPACGYAPALDAARLRA